MLNQHLLTNGANMRITEKDLGILVDRLNKLTGSPASYFGEDRKTNVGHFCLDWAYGGVQLQRVCNECGGVSVVFSCGYTTKRSLYDLIHAYIKGYELAKGL